jgi:hypothetical protein
MLNKKILGAVMLAAVAASSAAVAGDRDFNTVAGAVVGAAIGHSTGSRNGTVIGGVLGAAVGNSINTDSRSYNRGGYYETRNYQQPAQVYYQQPQQVYYERPAPVYYAPPPRYYGPPAVVYVEPERGYYRGHGRRWEGRRDYDDDRGERHHGHYR